MSKKKKVATVGFVLTTLIAFLLFINTTFKNVGKIEKLEED